MTPPLRRDPCAFCGCEFTQPRKRGRPRILCDECASPEAVASRIAEKKRAYYEANREAIMEKQRAYYAANRA
jgi:hypothetical protein